MDSIAFKIFVDRLRGGKEESLVEKLSPDFIGVREDDVAFTKPIFIQGKGYVVDQELYLHFSVALKVDKPCSRCNEWGPCQLEFSFDHAEPLSNCKSGVFDFSELLREEILLALPHYWKCSESCQVGEKKYLAKEKKDQSQENPFANIQLPDL